MDGLILLSGFLLFLPHAGCRQEGTKPPSVLAFYRNRLWRILPSYLLAVLAWLLRRMDNAFGWAVFSGAYGLCFGGLCAAVYLVAKTPAFALSWWLSGLSYDVMHGAGNFVIMLLLYRPLRTALQTAKRLIRR